MKMTDDEKRIKWISINVYNNTGPYYLAFLFALLKCVRFTCVNHPLKSVVTESTTVTQIPTVNLASFLACVTRN